MQASPRILTLCTAAMRDESLPPPYSVDYDIPEYSYAAAAPTRCSTPENGELRREEHPPLYNEEENASEITEGWDMTLARSVKWDA